MSGRTSWGVEATKDLRVALRIGSDKCVVEPRDAGAIGIALLDTVRECDGEADQGSDDKISWIILRATDIALVPLPLEPGAASLVVGFGQARLGVTLSGPMLRSLGTAMIELSYLQPLPKA